MDVRSIGISHTNLADEVFLDQHQQHFSSARTFKENNNYSLLLSSAVFVIMTATVPAYMGTH